MKNLRKLVTLAVSLTMCLSFSSAALAITANSEQKAVDLQLTTACENGKTKLVYNYAEKLGSFDGRGITFGCIGFTTGTYDGNILIHYYTKLNPNNNLAKYIPALDRIDKEEHDEDGKNDDIKGLDNFIKDVKACNDPLFKKAQLYELDEMYWKPAVSLATSIGAKHQLTLAFIYDMCVNHGEDGAKEYINSAKKKLGGLPKDGIDENKFLSSVMDYRYAFLKDDDPEGSDRVNAYRKLLKAGNVDLKPDFSFTVYGDTFNIDSDVY
ncbi:chitosanase [Clostridium beijerinckii]|uniref:chitosanase n=1 Tax=Clostridium beijerinckii TaxID=1520 RepID=UPI000809B557|nr:chitosanase [Clostridium beijerinckii]OCA99224.1 glycoside hydrolase [Clostridium beijerinckii]